MFGSNSSPFLDDQSMLATAARVVQRKPIVPLPKHNPAPPPRYPFLPSPQRYPDPPPCHPSLPQRGPAPPPPQRSRTTQLTFHAAEGAA